MELTILGTGSDAPRPERPLSAAALRMDSALYLLDCGEGTQLTWTEARLNLASLRVVALTHLHPAQVLGLPGLLARRGQLAGAETLTVVAPKGAQELIVPLLLGLGVRLSYGLRFVELDGPVPGKKKPMPVAYEDEQLTLRWLPVDHTVPCVAYRLEEHPRPGRFDPAVAQARGIAPGPDFGTLRAGTPVTAPDGTVVKPEDVVGPPRPGRTLCWVADSAPCKALYRLLDGADLALVGGGWLQEHAEVAASMKQLTVRDASRICSRAKVGQALLTQLSPRLSEERIPEADALAAEQGEGFRCASAGERMVVATG